MTNYKKTIVAASILTLILVVCLAEQAWLAEYYWVMKLWGFDLHFANGFIAVCMTIFVAAQALAAVYLGQQVWTYLTRKKKQ